MSSCERRDSMSQVLIELSLPSADTVIYISRVLFRKQYTTCINNIVAWFISPDCRSNVENAASTGGVLATKSERKMLASTCLYSLYACFLLSRQ